MVRGYVATAAAFGLLVEACRRGGDTGRVSLWWLSSSYLLLSLAEVRLSPLGLALITQLAPPRLASRAVGLWFLVIALSNGLTGALGLLWGRWPNHRYFGLLALLSLGAGAILLMRLSSLSALLRRIAASSVPLKPTQMSGGLS
jgi:POT family proton-dependent oligopeptide transporter